MIKGIVTSIPQSLRYQLPYSSLSHCASFAIHKINLILNKTDYLFVSPLETFTSIKISRNTDERYRFDKCIEHVTSNTVKNSMISHIESCMSSFPVGNIQGSVKVLSSSTFKIITRDHLIVLSMPDHVINNMNERSESEKSNSKLTSIYSTTTQRCSMKLKMMQIW
jgi:hypothetical protein